MAGNRVAVIVTRVLFWAILSLIAGVSALYAQESAPPGSVQLDPAFGDRLALDLARKKLAEGDADEAFRILAILEHRHPGNRNLQVLIAQAEVGAGRHERAIQRLEVLRERHPDWPRPRVELALAHAAAGNVRTGKNILIAELGKDPPPHVRRNLEAAIRMLEDRQAIVGRFSFGVVPDSNITGGTHNDTVQYLGLPFELNDDAKEKSGVRGEISGGVTVRSGWRENVRVELSADLHHSEPLGDEGTPSSNAKLALASRIRGRKGGLYAGIALQPFYYDNEMQRVERSIFLQPSRRLSNRLSLVGDLTLTEGAYLGDDLRDFRQWQVGTGPSIRVSPATRLQITGIFGVRNAEDELYSYIRRGISANLVTAPANGWRLSLSGALTRDVYREESVFWGKRQEDILTAASFQVVRSGIVVWGFSPSFGLGYSEVRSSIDLYDKRSYSFQLGFARPF